MKAVLGILTVVGFLSASVEARAQQAKSFNQLQVLVKPGDIIEVTGSDGKASSGRMLDLSDSALRLLVNGAPKAFSESDVSRVEQWHHASFGKGAAIGAISGTSLVGVAAAIGCRGANCDAPLLVAAFGVYAGLGAAAGVGIAALIPVRKTVFQNGVRSLTTRLRVTPIGGMSNRGVMLSMSF